MDLATITRLDNAAVNRLTSELYREAFDDPITGDSFRKRIDEIENGPKRASRPNGSVRGEEAPAPSPIGGFDPSFDDAPNNAPSASAPATPTTEPITAAADELPLMIHEYQPTDKNGRPVGGKQVFKYKTQADLISQLTKAHMASSARIRELSRVKKLEEIVATKKTPHPSAELPTTMESLAQELIATREEAFLASVRNALTEFKAAKGWERYCSEENAGSIIAAIERAGDDPREVESYHKAFAAMEQFLDPVVRPVVAATAEPTTQVVAPVLVPPTRTTQGAGISSGISNADVFSSESPIEPITANAGQYQGWTHAKIEALSTEAYRRIVRDPKMAHLFDRALQEHEDRLAAARRGR